MKKGDKIRCINNKGITGISINSIYTVLISGTGTFKKRVWIKENKEDTFYYKQRFELVNQLYNIY